MIKASQEQLEENILIIKTIINELDPDIETDHGVFHDRLIYYAALFATINQEKINEIIEQNDITEIIKNPDTFSETVIDKFVYRWLLKRKQGSYASGNVKIVFNKRIGMIIPKNLEFIYNNIRFKLSNNYTIITTRQATLSNNDVFLEQDDDGYHVILPITAITKGVIGNLKKGIQLHTSINIKNIKSVTVNDDFINGLNTETNTQLINRLITTLSN